ncbi:MAG: YCF48-related protein, partial [Gemmatimonadales bacterium]
MPDDPRDTDPRARGIVEPVLEALDYLASVIRGLTFWDIPHDWDTISPAADQHHFLDVCLVDEEVGYAVGEGGVIIKTGDGGQSWIQLEHGLTTVRLWGVHFVDRDTGYVVGSEATALKTTNGGDTWTQLPVPAGAALHIRGVHFTDPQTGVIVGGAEHLRMMEDQIGYHYQPGQVLRTNDGGQTWAPADEVPSVLPFLKAVSLTAGGVGMAVGGSTFPNPVAGGYQMTSVIVRTLDGGATWHLQANPYDIPDSYYDKPLEDVALHSPSKGIAVGGSGVPPIYTSDGETWESSSRDNCVIQWQSSTAFVDGNTAVAVGETCAGAGVYRSTNAGQYWSLVDYGNYPSLRGVSFGSGNRGAAVGRLGTVIISEDAGQTWYPSPDFPVAPVSENETIRAVHFIDADIGFAVGHFGGVLKT